MIMHGIIYKVMLQMLDERAKMDRLCLKGVPSYSPGKLAKIETS